jgi:hypothetical protein
MPGLANIMGLRDLTPHPNPLPFEGRGEPIGGRSCSMVSGRRAWHYVGKETHR